MILSYPIFLGERAQCNFGKTAVNLSVTPTVSCSDEQSFSILRRPKTNLRSIMEQYLLSHLALLRTLVNRVDFRPIIDQKRW